MDKETKALLFGKMKHYGQKDDDGKSYFLTHCLQVYHIMTKITNDEDMLCAAILHDTLEDTDTTYEELVEKFGERVAKLVSMVTHDGDKDKGGYYFPRLKKEDDIDLFRDAVCIKFADRLSNISRMTAWDTGRKEHYLKRSKFWKIAVDDFMNQRIK